MKITIFTSNGLRHLYLINKLSKIAKVSAVIETKTLFPGKLKGFFCKSPQHKKYFDKVNKSELKFFKQSNYLKNIDYIIVGRIGKYRKGLIPANFKPQYYVGTNLSHKGLHIKTSYSVGGYSNSAWQMEIGQNIFRQHFQFVLGTYHFGSIFKGINSSNADFYFSLNFLFGEKI